MGKTETLIPILLFNLFFIAFIFAIIAFVKQYKLKKKQHVMFITQQQAEHKQELLSTQIEMQQQTMQHIGREIHDNIGQKLTLASLYIQQLEFENKAPQINSNIENISTIINQSLSDLRSLSKSLTDNDVLDKSIFELINQEKIKVETLKKCKISFTSNDENLDLDYQTKTILLRISQEFIQNSIKHSNCKNIFIKLINFNKNVNLILEDDGEGFDVDAKQSGIGLKNIKKRTEIINGNCILKSDKTGTKLTIEIPN